MTANGVVACLESPTESTSMPANGVVACCDAGALRSLRKSPLTLSFTTFGVSQVLWLLVATDKLKWRWSVPVACCCGDGGADMLVL